MKVLASALVVLTALPTVTAEATDYWAFGDSITRGEGNGFWLDPVTGSDCVTANPYPSKCGYHWRLENTLGAVTNDVVNRGIAGEGTAAGITRIVLSGEPLFTSRCTDPDADDVLLLMEGTNDFGMLLTADIRDNLEVMLDLATTKCVHSVVASTIRLLKAGTNDGSKEGDWGYLNPAPTDLKTAISTLAGDKNRAFVNVWASLCPNQTCYGFTQPPTTNFWGRLGPGDPGHVSNVGYDTMSPLFFAAITAVPLPGAATLTGPSGDVTDSTPAFTWNEHANSDWYFLEIDAGVSYERWHPEEEEQIMGIDICTGGVCTYDPGVPLADGAHTWRVRTRNLRGVGSWSASTPFTVWTTLPGATTATAPSGDTCEATPGPYPKTFAWNAATNAKDYRLEVKNSSMAVVFDQTFSGAAVCAGNCSVTPGTNFAAGAYTWKVMATNPAGNGPWSASIPFSMFPTDLVLPDPGVVNTTVTEAACEDLSAVSGYVVGATGVVTFQAGTSIELGNGFEVLTGGTFTAAMD